MNQSSKFAVNKRFVRPATLSDYLKSSDFDSLADSSLKKYSNVIESLVLSSGDESVSGIIKYFSSMVSGKRISLATAKLYRAAISHWIGLQGAQFEFGEKSKFDYLERCYVDLGSIDFRKLDKKSIRTSGSKIKAVTQDSLDYLGSRLRDRDFSGEINHTYLSDAILFLKANSLIGLRPVEWSGIRFFTELGANNERIPSISVRNAKHSYGRSFADRRELNLNGITSVEYALIVNCSKMLAWHEADSGSIESAVNRLRVALSKAQFVNKNYTIDKKVSVMDFVRINELDGIHKNGNVTLYSSRHQAIANAKKSGLNVDDIAAFFGHRSIKTAQRDYARATVGRAGFRFSPSLKCKQDFISSNIASKSAVRLSTRPVFKEAIAPVVTESNNDLDL